MADATPPTHDPQWFANLETFVLWAAGGAFAVGLAIARVIIGKVGQLDTLRSEFDRHRADAIARLDAIEANQKTMFSCIEGLTRGQEGIKIIVAGQPNRQDLKDMRNDLAELIKASARP